MATVSLVPIAVLIAAITLIVLQYTRSFIGFLLQIYSSRVQCSGIIWKFPIGAIIS